MPRRILLRRLAWLLALAAASAPCGRAWAEDAPTGPLVFDAPVHDFGIVDQDREYQAEIGYRNVGTTALEDIRARSGCSCYGATVSAPTLEPGQTGVVRIRFRTHAFRGRVAKVLTLLHGRGDGEEAKIRLQLDVVGGVLVSRLHFGEVLAGTQPEGSTTVGWYEGVGKPFQILRVDVPNLPVAARLEPWVVKERIVPAPTDPAAPTEKVTYRGYRLHFHFTEPPPKGVLSAKAILTTDNPEHPRVLIPLTANVVGKVWVQTSRIYLGLVPRGEARTASLIFRGFDASVRLGTLSARARKGLLQVQISDDMGPTGPHKLLSVTVPANAPPGSLEDVVELRTEVPGEERVEIRVLGRVFERIGK